jgi:hypothetical protein
MFGDWEEALGARRSKPIPGPVFAALGDSKIRCSLPYGFKTIR